MLVSDTSHEGSSPSFGTIFAGMLHRFGSQPLTLVTRRSTRLPRTNFLSNGSMGKSSEQKRAHADRMRAQYRSRMAAATAYLGGTCRVCGAVDNLEFDHIDPSSKFKDVASLTGYKKDTFWCEVRKCQLLCTRCHVKKTVVADMGNEYYGGAHDDVVCLQCGKSFQRVVSKLAANERRDSVNLCSKTCVGLYSTVGPGQQRQGCGTVAGYMRCGPPTCSACRAAFAAYNRERRLRRK